MKYEVRKADGTLIGTAKGLAIRIDAKYIRIACDMPLLVEETDWIAIAKFTTVEFSIEIIHWIGGRQIQVLVVRNEKELPLIRKQRWFRAV